MDFMTFLKVQRDRVAAWVLIGGGAVCVALGWRGVTNTIQVYQQLTYLVSGAVVGLFLLGVGVALLLSADFHDEWRKLDRIEAALRGSPIPDPDEVVIEPAVAASSLPPLQGGEHGNHAPAMASALGADGALLLRKELTWAAPGVVAGIILVGVAWIKSTNSVDAQVGVDALLIAVYGLFVCGGGIALHSRGLRRALTERKVRLLLADRRESLLAALVGPIQTSPTTNEPVTPALPPLPGGDMRSSTGLFVAANGRRFHRASCAVLLSQRSAPATSAQVEQMPPCQLCLADQR